MKNPGLAALLSFFWCGLGQIYNGHIGKGIAFIFIQIINCFLTWVIIGWVTWPVFWIWGMVDAYKAAEAYNLKHYGKPS